METNVETFRIDYFIRTPKVEKLSLQPIRYIGIYSPLGLKELGSSALHKAHLETEYSLRLCF